MKKIYFQLFFLVLFTLTGMTVSGQNTGMIKGTVTDANTGKPLARVEVYIHHLKLGGVSDSKGHYVIKNVPAGRHAVEAKLLGYFPKHFEDVKVKAGEVTTLNIKMEMTSITFDEVEISATKIPQTVRTVSSPVYVIDKKSIDLTTERRNVGEAMLSIPGVFTEDRRHGESNVISFRGVGLHTYITRGILVLVDGVPITEASGRTLFEGVDMDHAEKIEVLKGPVSALYGPNGITGVINIIEKSPEEGFHGDINGSYGSYNFQKFSGDVNGGKGNFRYLAKAGYYHTDGYQDRTEYTSGRAGIKLIQDFGKMGKLQFTGDYTKDTSQSGGPLDSIQFVERSRVATRKFTGWTNEIYRFNLHYDKQFGEKSDLFVNSYFSGRNTTGHYLDTKWGEDNVRMYGGEVRYKLVSKISSAKNYFVVGTSFDRQTDDNHTYSRDGETGVIGSLIWAGKSTYDMLGIYAEDRVSLFQERLDLTFGLRFDYIGYDWEDNFHTGDDNTSGTSSLTNFSPKFGFAYNPLENLTVFGNISRGFNPPQISQLFTSTYVIPNPDLKPEYLTNYEIGVRGNLWKNAIHYQVSVFRMDFTDQIVSDGYPATYINIGNTRHDGVEVSLRYHYKRKFTAFLAYSYLNATFIDNPDTTLIGNQLRKTPHNMFSAGATYAFDFGLSFTVDYQFIDAYYMDNYDHFKYPGHSLVNAKVNYRYKKFTASLAVNNIFDVNYATWAYAGKRYDYVTHQTVWYQYYSPGWPVNYVLSVGYHF
ncbi:TonB-dependent receptor [Candidatus Sulfidibacterium hydrothermale]|uniref:TonB-dependent receptor n=1 Tax=Candidatus Sulfidibacterium hydrothermale TaxID=2875962 RepID=UPI001F0A4A85|nr:TonB-dependent receptor [Candidatus Sulfidibacterium hydrothermale]UBM61765.1 TonB-dependent receptor [Candidatus Sulfidibacterium hydrothermale]